MKQQLIALCIPLILVIHPLKSSAQEGAAAEPRQAPGWVSDKGYWQVETNIRTPWNSMISFFNNDGILVYKENVQGMALNLQRKSILRRLKKILDRSVTAWESGHPGKESRLLVTRSLRRN
jgi:hypothetical protein